VANVNAAVKKSNQGDLPMRRLHLRLLTCGTLAAVFMTWNLARPARAELNAKQLVDAIEKAKQLLLLQQQEDGSWKQGKGVEQYETGDTSLALLALLNTGMSLNDPPIERGLNWLRRKRPETTYEISLMIQVLATAKDGKRDFAQVSELAGMLELSQVRQGPNAGSWWYNKSAVGGADRSNGQFAVLGLREAQEMGVSVSLETWRRARNHWLSTQNGDGSWSYNSPKQGAGGTASMTVAGITTLIITQAMLRQGDKELNADGTPYCCGDPVFDQPLEDAYRWLGNNFSVKENRGDGRWVLYYLYGLERAGRFSGRRFFIDHRAGREIKHDWYREGAEYLITPKKGQIQFSGLWGEGDQNPIRSSSFALMFLSKGLAPVLINKLQHGPPRGKKPGAGADWNRHPDDIRNLTQLISNRPKWPKLITWQTVELAQATLPDLMQAPILFISGSDAPQFDQRERDLLKDFVLQGGFILIDNNCRSSAFDDGVRDLIRQMYPPSEAQLKKLTADHPVFRSEFDLVDPKTNTPPVELWGVDVGCRTSIMYSPHDLSCLWDKWTSFKVENRPPAVLSMITEATKVGVNIVAYVTGRELLDKLTQQEQMIVANEPDRIQRGLVEIRKIKYNGDWDAAPQALKNLLVALNRTAGAPTATRSRELQILDATNLFRTPIIYMHGRHDFNFNKNEQEQLRKYIAQGGALFSDSCCGAPGYDRSFRNLMKQMFPDNPLKRIPPDHEIFKIGHELKTVKRREPDVDQATSALQVSIRTAEPFLEGIEINGRYVIVYSKYDISCALERQASVACTGYVHEDAVRIGVNVITYFFDQ
jgi:hypothetical protein